MRMPTSSRRIGRTTTPLRRASSASPPPATSGAAIRSPPLGSQQALGALALGQVLVGVVARPHQRAGGDGLEAEVVGGLLEGRELVGVPVADDRQVVLGRAEVLADGEDL